MNTQFFTVAAIFIGLSFSSCAKINGTGSSVTENRTTSEFNSIRTAISADVYLRQDSVFKVEVSGQKDILDVLNTTVNGRELKIDFDHNKRIGSHSKIEIWISCPDIKKLSLSGSGNLTALNNFSGENMDLEVSGSGSINITALHTDNVDATISGSGNISILNGKATKIKTNVSGSGYIDFTGMKTNIAAVKISGSGDTKVNVSDELNVKISGSGDVYYKGRPLINTEISGSGKLKAL